MEYKLQNFSDITAADILARFTKKGMKELISAEEARIEDYRAKIKAAFDIAAQELKNGGQYHIDTTSLDSISKEELLIMLDKQRTKANQVGAILKEINLKTI